MKIVTSQLIGTKEDPSPNLNINGNSISPNSMHRGLPCIKTSQIINENCLKLTFSSCML